MPRSRAFARQKCHGAVFRAGRAFLQLHGFEQAVDHEMGLEMDERPAIGLERDLARRQPPPADDAGVKAEMGAHIDENGGPQAFARRDQTGDLKPFVAL